MSVRTHSAYLKDKTESAHEIWHLAQRRASKAQASMRQMCSLTKAFPSHIHNVMTQMEADVNM